MVVVVVVVDNGGGDDGGGGDGGGESGDLAAHSQICYARTVSFETRTPQYIDHNTRLMLILSCREARVGACLRFAHRLRVLCISFLLTGASLHRGFERP
jgi:hypothetical protein